MKIKLELSGWYPEMVKALKENRKMDASFSDICKVLIESWLIDNEDTFKEEFERLKNTESNIGKGDNSC